MRTCSVEGCENKHFGKGYCSKHYYHYKKYGYIPERTRFDANEIIEYEDYAEMILYDKNDNEVARVLIDLECIDLVKKYKWHLSSHNYVYNKKAGFLHRYIMNPTDNLVVDHINRNQLDNRRENLRICTQQKNMFNQSKRCTNTSGVIGVSFDKERNKWAAQIMINGKNKHLGRYDTLEEAADARRQAEIEYFGEFAPTKE